MLAAALEAEQGQVRDDAENAGPGCAGGGRSEEGQEGSMPGSPDAQGKGLEHQDHGGCSSGHDNSTRERQAPGHDDSSRERVTPGGVVTMGELRPPSSWPSFSLLPCSRTIHLDTQDSSQQENGAAANSSRMEGMALTSQAEHVNPGGEDGVGDAASDLPGHGGDADDMGGGAALADDMASSAASAATRRSGLSGSESAEGGSKQTDLKGWIK